MLLVFYRILIESVLAQVSVSKEDIENIESIRQKYHISLTDHLSILSNIEEGTNLYTKYLEEFGILGVLFGFILPFLVPRNKDDLL